MEEYWSLFIVRKRVDQFYESEIKTFRKRFFQLLKEKNKKLEVEQRRFLNKCWRNVRKAWKKLDKTDELDYELRSSDFPALLKPWKEYLNALIKVKYTIFSD